MSHTPSEQFTPDQRAAGEPQRIGEILPEVVGSMQEAGYVQLREAFENWTSLDAATERGSATDPEQLRLAQEHLTSLIRAHQFGTPNQE